MKNKHLYFRIGILRFGLPTLILACVTIFLNHHKWDIHSLYSCEFLIMLLFFIVGGIFAGVILGNLMWNRYKIQETTSLELIENEQLVKCDFANQLSSIESIGGKLYLTNLRLIFKPHRLNFQKNQIELKLNKIIRVSESKFLGIYPTKLIIESEGKSYKFITDNHKDWFSIISKKSL
jgi:hypothetical protein